MLVLMEERPVRNGTMIVLTFGRGAGGAAAAAGTEPIGVDGTHQPRSVKDVVVTDIWAVV